MKIETKILIVAIIMILSVGPTSYFFSGSTQQIELPNQTNSVTSYYVSGNVTGTIMELKPYIIYLGVSQVNSRSYVESILDSIPDIQNYSVEISLNPSGEGYQYTITVPVNDTAQIKKIGFRLAWRFRSFFEQNAGSIPYVLAKLMLPSNFQVPTVNGTVNVTTQENQTISAVLTYAKQEGARTMVFCQNMLTSLTYLLVKPPTLCYDNDLFISQAYLGLTLMDIIFVPTHHQVMNLEAPAIIGIEFQGTYKFPNASAVSITGLEGQTNSTIYLQPYENDSNAGNFTIEGPYYGMDNVNYIKSVFKDNNFTITKEYKQAYVALPKNATIDNKTYEIYKMPTIVGKIGINDEIGFYNFDMAITVIYDEVTNIQATKVNLS